LLCSQLSLNLGAALAKHLFRKIGVEGVTAYRVGIAAIIMLAVFRPWRTPLTLAQGVNVAIYGSVIGLMNRWIVPSAASRWYRGRHRSGRAADGGSAVLAPAAISLAVALAAVGLYFLRSSIAVSISLDPVGVAMRPVRCVLGLYIVFGKRVSVMHGGQSVAWPCWPLPCSSCLSVLGMAAARCSRHPIWLSVWRLR
jgi:inner membrane transporter RhtA